ncbi:MAG: flagellar biosynthesis protein FlhF [Halanaerobium sp.]|nr:MAG: flagellar biosynthesis protein FlhF [Halanaerobium sp.]
MKVKKYTGETMQDVIFQVKADLGPEAVIVNKRKLKQGGFFGFFGKEVFEVVAALDSKESDSETTVKEDNNDDIVEISNYGRKTRKVERTKIQKTASKDPENKNAIKEFIDDLKTAAGSEVDVTEKKSEQPKQTKTSNQTVEPENSFKKELKNQQNLTAAQKLQNKFDQKNTTMAKIAAHFAVDKNKNVGLITADTYRIAAVEQLQTYSKIIDIPFAVCYSSSKLEEMIAGQFRNCDLVLIDTPGSSWKDQIQLGRLKDYVDHTLVDEVHLLLSLNTKSSDLRSIISEFSKLKPDRALLTKLDETSSYGDIINIKENYNLSLSYLTCGQDVPEDFEIAGADQIYSYLFGDFYA